jgi:hypothetical protein
VAGTVILLTTYSTIFTNSINWTNILFAVPVSALCLVAWYFAGKGKAMLGANILFYSFLIGLVLNFFLTGTNFLNLSTFPLIDTFGLIILGYPAAIGVTFLILILGFYTYFANTLIYSMSAPTLKVSLLELLLYFLFQIMAISLAIYLARNLNIAK